MRKSVIALIAVVVLAGAAVAAVPVIERHAAANIKSEIERNGTAKVDSTDGYTPQRVSRFRSFSQYHEPFCLRAREGLLHSG